MHHVDVFVVVTYCDVGGVLCRAWYSGASQQFIELREPYKKMIVSLAKPSLSQGGVPRGNSAGAIALFDS